MHTDQCQRPHTTHNTYNKYSTYMTYAYIYDMLRTHVMLTTYATYTTYNVYDLQHTTHSAYDTYNTLHMHSHVHGVYYHPLQVSVWSGLTLSLPAGACPSTVNQNAQQSVTKYLTSLPASAGVDAKSLVVSVTSSTCSSTTCTPPSM